MQRNYLIIVVVLLVVATSILVLSRTSHNGMQSSGNKIKVVAAENFYGDIVKQLGRNHVSILSILSDPNADPHQYESNVQDGIAVTNANIVIENGDGYDTWMDKLLSGGKNSKRAVIIASKVATHKLEDNPHVWYGINNMPDIAGKITEQLKKVDPNDSAEFDQNLKSFTDSLKPLQQEIAMIKAKYNSTPVGLTETIYLYQTKSEGLNVITPLGFEKAIAEGNEPSADDVAKTNDQISKKQVKILIYNVQTVTPITTNVQNLAKQQNIPIVPVSETLPQGKSYQGWMLDQLKGVESALQSVK